MGNNIYKSLKLNNFHTLENLTVIGIDEDGLLNVIDNDGKYFRLDTMGEKPPILVENIDVEEVLRSEEPDTEEKNETKKKKPHGWALRSVYIDDDGNTYHKGVLQSK